MLKVVQFKREHYVNLQRSQITEDFVPFISEDHIVALEQQEYTRTFLNEHDEVIACCGLIFYWPGRYEGWAMVRRDCKEYMVQLHRTIKDFLDEVDIKRIEATTKADCKVSRRWARLLGFKVESAKLKAYFPDGADGIMYSRVK